MAPGSTHAQNGFHGFGTIQGDAADCNPYFYPKELAKTTNGGQTWQILQLQIMP